MTHFIKIWLLLTLLAIATPADGLTQEPTKTSFYLIGNSLTWDTVPSRLSGDVQWHVDCGTHLRHVYEHPGKPCVTNSTLWPTALRDKQYDVISVQPHYGSTLAQDVDTIGAWMKLQPRAVFVIHSGWAKEVQRADEFASYTAPNAMEHSPAYFRALLAELRRQHPVASYGRPSHRTSSPKSPKTSPPERPRSRKLWPSIATKSTSSPRAENT